MVKRGFCRHLWGNERACCHEFVVLMLRASQNDKLTDEVSGKETRHGN
jgi:hypothetical protein